MLIFSSNKLIHFTLFSAKEQPISVDMACHKALSTVACSFEFTNNANEDLYLLKRDTPLEGLFSPFITVFLDNNPIQYEGIVAYRIPPTKEEFILLKAGDRISATVQITDVFRFDADGLYTVRYSKPLQYLSVDEMSLMSTDNLKESLVDESVYIYLENAQLLSKPEEPEAPKIDYTVHLQDCASASFAGGNRDNAATLAAHKKLCAQIDVAKGKIANNDLYKKWFGSYTAARSDKAKALYKRVGSGLADKTVTYHNAGPRCRRGVVAYTFITGRPYTTVYFCDGYFKHPTYCSGTRYTKERTIMHEWAHALGYAKDIAYYSGRCQKLAKDNPDKAVKNADSYSFHYCESY